MSNHDDARGRDPWRFRARIRWVAIPLATITILLIALRPVSYARSAAASLWFVAWFGGLALTIIWPPRPGAARMPGGVVLRHAAWRRWTLALVGPVGVLAPATGWEGRERAIGVAAYVLCAALLASTLFADVFSVTASHVARTRGFGRKPKLRWEEIRAVVPTARIAGAVVRKLVGPSGGVMLYFGERWPMKVQGTVDGYPEFMAQLLARAPVSSLATLTAAERREVEAIARLAAPGALAGTPG